VEKLLFFSVAYGLIAVLSALTIAIPIYLLVLPFKGHEAAAKVFKVVFVWSFIPLLPLVWAYVKQV
jgi:hypothetical protein